MSKKWRGFEEINKFNCLDNSKNDENIPCGRPLGMAFDTISNSLIVMQSLQGVFAVDLTTGEKTQLVHEKDVIGDVVRCLFIDSSAETYLPLLI